MTNRKKRLAALEKKFGIPAGDTLSRLFTDLPSHHYPLHIDPDATDRTTYRGVDMELVGTTMGGAFGILLSNHAYLLSSWLSRETRFFNHEAVAFIPL